MTFSQDDDFTRDLNDRIRELEDMTNEMDDMTTEIENQANKGEETETSPTEATEKNQSQDARKDGDTIFFTANVDAQAPLVLNVVNNNGDLEVYGTDSNHVEISATRNSGEDVDHDHWFFQQVDNEITLRPNWQVGSHVGDIANKIKTQLKEGFKTSDWSSKDFKFGLDVNYDIVVRMPKNLVEGSRVILKTASGDGQLKDVQAEVDFKTANGDLNVEGVGGSLTINTANGDLVGKQITGNAHASTANGDIRLEGVTGSVECNTANGDIMVDGASGWVAMRTANGDAHARNVTMKGGRFATVGGDITVDGVLNNAASYTFDTVTGEVQVNVRVPSAGATLNGKSVSGDISAEGDWTKQGKREWTIGEGAGPRMSTKSVSGDITITAVVDPEITMLQEDPAADLKDGDADSTSAKKDGDININLDIELERAKGWLKDLGGKIGTMLGEVPTPQKPEAPQAPEPPKAPEAPEKVAATAERRTKLLEAVKNGEMTIDEALAELEREA